MKTSIMKFSITVLNALVLATASSFAAELEPEGDIAEAIVTNSSRLSGFNCIGKDDTENAGEVIHLTTRFGRGPRGADITLIENSRGSFLYHFIYRSRTAGHYRWGFIQSYFSELNPLPHADHPLGKVTIHAEIQGDSSIEDMYPDGIRAVYGTLNLQFPGEAPLKPIRLQCEPVITGKTD